MSDTARLQADFWRGFKKSFNPTGYSLDARKSEKHHMDFGIGVPFALLTARFSPAELKIAAELTLTGEAGRETYERMKSKGDEVAERKMSRPVKWKTPPPISRKGTVDPEYGVLVDLGVTPCDRSSWPRHYDWLAGMILKFKAWAEEEMAQP